MVRFLTRSGIVVVAVSLVSFNLQGIAQQEVSIEHATPQQMAGIAKDNSRHFGDDPDDGGPIAKDLSPSLDPSSVGAAMRKVANWQLKRSQPYFDRIWTWSVLYSGFVAASDSLSDAKYRDAMEEMGKKFDWELRSHLPDADDQSVGQTYLELYLLKKDPAMMVVRCVVHGSPRMGEDVRRDWRPEIHCLSRRGVDKNLRSALRQTGASLCAGRGLH
jgi:unsaturated rhamnogalacturonyl hydrolase